MNTNSNIEQTNISVELRDVERDCESLRTAVGEIERLVAKYTASDRYSLYDIESASMLGESLTSNNVKFVNGERLNERISDFEEFWAVLYDLQEMLSVQHDMIYRILEIARERVKV